MIVRVCSVVLRRTVVGVDVTLMIASAQVVEMSVNTNNSPSQDYTTNPDDHSNHNNVERRNAAVCVFIKSANGKIEESNKAKGWMYYGQLQFKNNFYC